MRCVIIAVRFSKTMNKRIIRRYSELMQIPTFEERLAYLKLDGAVGSETFGFDRYLNQALYRSSEWKRVRNLVIVRDSGCDLGCEDRPIFGAILIHHLNPITEEAVESRDQSIFDLNNLICVSHETHNQIHYGSAIMLPEVVERTPNDTCPWK